MKTTRIPPSGCFDPRRRGGAGPGAAAAPKAEASAIAIVAQSSPLKALMPAGNLKIVAARYDLTDGRMTPIWLA